MHMASGEEALAIPFQEFVEVTGAVEHVRALDLKRHLQGLSGQPLFKQRLLDADGQILSDDAVLNGPADVQLVLQPYSPSSQDQIRKLHFAAGWNDIEVLKQLLQRPQDPNVELDSYNCLFLTGTGNHESLLVITVNASFHRHCHYTSYFHRCITLMY